jgi:hypothetical protein
MASVQSSRPNKPTGGRLAHDHEFRSRLSSWSNKQHQDQSKAGIILWLQERYETGYRESIAKEDVYAQYVEHCTQEGTEPLRASMFGKLVHRAFPGLKSSRIGTRGATRHSYKSFRPRGVHGIATPAPHQAQPPAPSTGAPRSDFLHSGNVLPPQQRCYLSKCFPVVSAHHKLEEETDGNSSSAELSSRASSPVSSSFSLPSDEIYSSSPPSDWASQHAYAPPAYHHFTAGTTHPGTATQSSFFSSPFPSPTLPFDSFSYTSVAFSPYLAGPSSATQNATVPTALPCVCDECIPFSMRHGGPTFPSPDSSYYHNPTTTTYNWSGQSATPTLLRRQVSHQFPIADSFGGLLAQI